MGGGEPWKNNVLELLWILRGPLGLGRTKLRRGPRQDLLMGCPRREMVTPQALVLESVN